MNKKKEKKKTMPADTSQRHVKWHGNKTTNGQAQNKRRQICKTEIKKNHSDKAINDSTGAAAITTKKRGIKPENQASIKKVSIGSPASTFAFKALGIRP